MPWVRTDDNFDTMRKVRKAWRDRRGDAVGLLNMSLSYSNREGLDGFIDPEWVELQVLEIVDWEAPPGIVQAMLDHELWVPMTGGWQIHEDFLQHQPTAEEAFRVREARRLAGKLGGRTAGKGRPRGRPSENAKANDRQTPKQVP